MGGSTATLSQQLIHFFFILTRWRGPIETVAGIQSDRVCGAGAEGGPEVHPLGPHQGQGAQLLPNNNQQSLLLTSRML